MLKVIGNAINVITGAYVMYVVVGTIYGMGKEAGKKEAVIESVPVGVGPVDENGNPDYKIIDGVLYKRMDKKQ